MNLKTTLWGLCLPLALQAQKTTITAVSWSPDGRVIAYSQQSDVVGESCTRIVDVEKRLVLHQLPRTVYALQFTPDGTYLDLGGLRWDWRNDSIIRALSPLESTYLEATGDDKIAPLASLNAFARVEEDGLYLSTASGYDLLAVSYYNPALLHQPAPKDNQWKQTTVLYTSASAPYRAHWQDVPGLGCDHARHFARCQSLDEMVGFLFHTDSERQAPMLGVLLASAQEIQRFPLAGLSGQPFDQLRFSPDGRYALVAAGPYWSRIDLDQGKQWRSDSIGSYFQQLRYTPDGKKIVGLNNETVYYWDKEGKLLSSAHYPNLAHYNGVWFLPDGLHYIVETLENEQRRLTYHRLSDHQVVREIKGFRLPFSYQQSGYLPEKGLISPEGRRIIVLKEDRSDWTIVALY